MRVPPAEREIISWPNAGKGAAKFPVFGPESQGQKRGKARKENGMERKRGNGAFVSGPVPAGRRAARLAGGSFGEKRLLLRRLPFPVKAEEEGKGDQGASREDEHPAQNGG